MPVNQCDHCGSPTVSNEITYYRVECLMRAVSEWYSAQLSGQHSNDQCGIDQNDQRRHIATERLLQECRRMWGDK